MGTARSHTPCSPGGYINPAPTRPLHKRPLTLRPQSVARPISLLACRSNPTDAYAIILPHLPEKKNLFFRPSSETIKQPPYEAAVWVIPKIRRIVFRIPAAHAGEAAGGEGSRSPNFTNAAAKDSSASGARGIDGPVAFYKMAGVSPAPPGREKTPAPAPGERPV